nr:MAG TPA: hypothetical protein [Caudoviricetes sp.]
MQKSYQHLMNFILAHPQIVVVLESENCPLKNVCIRGRHQAHLLSLRLLQFATKTFFQQTDRPDGIQRAISNAGVSSNNQVGLCSLRHIRDCISNLGFFPSKNLCVIVGVQHRFVILAHHQIAIDIFGRYIFISWVFNTNNVDPLIDKERALGALHCTQIAHCQNLYIAATAPNRLVTCTLIYIDQFSIDVTFHRNHHRIIQFGGDFLLRYLFFDRLGRKIFSHSDSFLGSLSHRFNFSFYSKDGGEDCSPPPNTCFIRTEYKYPSFGCR